LHVCGFFLPETPSRKRHPRQNPQRQWSVPNISGKKGGGRSSTFGAYWMGGELKMIREEVTGNPGMIEKNEFFFNAGALLHYTLQTGSLSRAG